MMDYR